MEVPYSSCNFNHIVFTALNNVFCEGDRGMQIMIQENNVHGLAISLYWQLYYTASSNQNLTTMYKNIIILTIFQKEQIHLRSNTNPKVI